MSYEVYRVRRKFQWNVWQYAVPGVCACSKDFGSEKVSTRYAPDGKMEEGQFDKNPCHGDLSRCLGVTGSACPCPDGGYCTCSIKPWMYGGDIWLVNEGDPRKEHILARRFVVYDPTLNAAEKYLEETKYKVLVMGEPNPDIVYFPPQGESITSPVSGSTITNDEALKPLNSEEPTAIDQALEAVGITPSSE